MTTHDAIAELQREIRGLEKQFSAALENPNLTGSARSELGLGISRLSQAAGNLSWAHDHIRNYTDLIAEERYAR